MTKFNRADYDTLEWRQMQAEVLSEADHVCAVCSGLWGRAKVAHHIHYSDGVLCKEALVALCLDCHDEVHSSSPYCKSCGEFFWVQLLDPFHAGWDYRRSFEEPEYCVDCAERFSTAD